MYSESKAAWPVALTIAGLDPSGGAGVIADIRTFIAFECNPAAAITSLTFQNNLGVYGAAHQTAETVHRQISSIIDENRVLAVKTGMLPTAELVREIARLCGEEVLPAPVVDPVLRSTSGYELMEPEAIKVLLSDLAPRARLLTPNVPEAETLTGLLIRDEEGMRAAARKLREMGAPAVLVKGGHLVHAASDSKAIDVLDEGDRVTVFRGDWIEAPPLRGTGCMSSAAIAACLAKNMNLEAAVGAAKRFVSDAILNFANLPAKPQ